MTQQAAPITYISTISNVREVALRGTADLAFWRERLHPLHIAPHDDNGRAALLLTSIEADFHGIPFRELSISVVVAGGGGAFLAHAFNSSRLLAFAERLFFQTPYHLAELTIDERVPARMAVSTGGHTPFSARMGQEAAGRRPVDETIEGPIYLPDGKHVFHARLSGAGFVYPFTTADILEIHPATSAPIFSQLLESGFIGQEWLVRAGAVHARSKTYSRTGS
ncbi:MAG: hypothetical protein KBF17_00890 [Candidatus Promineofilum sp.]|nr:hypothetical protein [Promineifilum sp.]